MGILLLYMCIALFLVAGVELKIQDLEESPRRRGRMELVPIHLDFIFLILYYLVYYFISVL